MWETVGKFLDLLRNPTIIGALLIIYIASVAIPVGAIAWTSWFSSTQVAGAIRTEGQQTRETIRTYFSGKKLVNTDE